MSRWFNFQLADELDGMYGRGKYRPPGRPESECQDLQDLSRLLSSSHDPKELEAAWVGWHSIAPPMRDKFARLVAVANEGARDLGYADVGSKWRSK